MVNHCGKLHEVALARPLVCSDKPPSLAQNSCDFFFHALLSDLNGKVLVCMLFWKFCDLLNKT